MSADADERRHGAVTAALGQVTATLVGGGEARPGQVKMALAVSDAIDSGQHLVVRAGTGTGKSLGYLVPALLSGRTVVVSTATKALQDQLANSDLPQLAATFGPDAVSFAVLKGRSNYFCRQRGLELEERGFQAELATSDEPVATGLVDQVRELLAWATRSRSGDRAELEREPSERAWSMVSTTPRECPGAFRCPQGSTCFAEQARQAAAEANVIVVNTHLYGAHLAAGGTVLPEHEVVIFDEAHEVEEIMTQSLGVELTPGRLRALVNLAKSALGDDAKAADPVGDAADRLEDLLEPVIGQRLRHSSPDDELTQALTLTSTRLEALTGALRRAESRSNDADDGPKALRAISAAGHLREAVMRLVDPGPLDVIWVDGNRRQPVLRLSPLDVAPSLSERLFEHVTAIMTSATITESLGTRLGLERERTIDLDVGSPFDFRENAMLYVPTHLPDRRSDGAEAAIHDELAALINAARGRTLALFTSWRAAQAARDALAPRLSYELMFQGELPKAKLLARFIEEPATCLFATMSFWQGVDVPGSSLNLVVLDRLPFARPDDPLMSARREYAGSSAFRMVDLPRAATLLAQGAGRLIRRHDDRGVVAVLDSRLATASYRAVLLDALPPMRRVTKREVALAFLTELADEADRH